ncbi:putative FmdB family regulatory protein [Natronospira proteinivora]|uniref:FmdB family regulatory protein n=1 Tax=Natronospira proteinivora TaxID=1807133 RepID=A0ABT1GC10_9GAMM|nr:zinc ribbon domain-containing protein [Natronospira proteinivora]MCP1727477.1 putative FmdB family regulatory protein [Natronospira proteinivora]
MPIYEYRCQACGHELEALQKMSDAPLTTCPQCEAESLTKLVSATAFRLAGSGWYETDFKKGNKRNLAGDGKTADKKSDSGSSTGSDKKSSNRKAETA